MINLCSAVSCRGRGFENEFDDTLWRFLLKLNAYEFSLYLLKGIRVGKSMLSSCL